MLFILIIGYYFFYKIKYKEELFIENLYAFIYFMKNLLINNLKNIKINLL